MLGHGRIYDPGQGTFFGALPLLRSPMGLFASPQLAAAVLAPASAGRHWTWDAITAGMQTVASRIDASGFSVRTFVREAVAAAEASAAFVAAYGGAIASSGTGSAAPALARPASLDGLDALVALRTARRLNFRQFGVPALVPGYLWDPFGGGAAPIYAETLREAYYAWPAGPSRRAVPASYLCAHVWEGGPRQAQAEDFCAYLLSSPAQRALARGGGGFVLRASDAVEQLPDVGRRIERPVDAVDASGDLTLADLYGGWKTDQNTRAIDRVADQFVAALGAVDDDLPSPEALPAVVGTALGA